MDDQGNRYAVKRCGPEDVEIVDAIMRHPDIYPNISDDNSVPATEYSSIGVLSNPLCYVLMPNDFSAIFLEPLNSICFLVHVNFLKPSRGPIAIEAGERTLDYIFNYTPCQKLIAFIATKFVNVMKFTENMGFSLEGINKSSILKNGILYDQFIYGLTKQEFKKCQKQQ